LYELAIVANIVLISLVLYAGRMLTPVVGRPASICMAEEGRYKCNAKEVVSLKAVVKKRYSILFESSTQKKVVEYW